MTAQRLLVLQSLWAMERRQPDGHERSAAENLDMIAAAGFDGVSIALTGPDLPREIGRAARARGLAIELMCFPATPEQLLPALDLAAALGVHHVNIQPNVRPRRLEDAVDTVRAWIDLARQCPHPCYFETHRDRMTCDLFFTLDLIERVPEMRLTADLSHYLVAREFAFPVGAEDEAAIHAILARTHAFHGRIASREQVQIELSFERHRPWVDLFARWWAHGFADWRARVAPGETLAFTCELGPQPYAIMARDGTDTTDRWAESLLLKDLARRLWTEGAAPA